MGGSHDARAIAFAELTKFARAIIACAIATPAPEELEPNDPDVDCILRLAEIVREVDGKHDLGAAALAEAILAHPRFSVCLDGPAAPPAPEVWDGPSLADVVKLCQEFFHIADPSNPAFAIVHEMITAAITRWPAPAAQPAAQPVDVANLMRLTEGVDPFAPGDPDPDHIERLAEIIREVDGKHELGVTILAEQILAHPDFSGCHDGPAAPAVSPIEPSPVVIGEAQNKGRDELYANWYQCPNCKDDFIVRSSNFCPECGVKLQWEGGATNA